MLALETCSSCRCYIQRREARCPFCGATARRQVAPHFGSRMSRARWAAIGSTFALMSCMDSTSKPPVAIDAASPDATTADVARDAGDAADTGSPATDAAPDRISHRRRRANAVTS